MSPLRAATLGLAGLCTAGGLVSAASGSTPVQPTAPLDRALLRPGPCSTAGPAIADAHQRSGDLASGTARPEDVVDPLTADQEGLVPLLADPQAGGQATDLRAAIGYLRIGVYAGSYVDSVARDLAAAQLALEQACSVAPDAP